MVPLRTFSFARCRLGAMEQPLGFTVDHVNSRLAHPILSAYLGDELTKRRSYLEPFTRCTRGTIPSSFGTSEEQDQRHDLHESKFRRRSTANLHLQVPNPGKYFCKSLPFNELSTQDVSSQSLKVRISREKALKTRERSLAVEGRKASTASCRFSLAQPPKPGCLAKHGIPSTSWRRQMNPTTPVLKNTTAWMGADAAQP